MEVVDWSEAVMFTPGGGRVGSLAGGAFDGRLADWAGRGDAGRLVEIEIGEAEALAAGLQPGTRASFLLVPADTLPSEVWEIAGAHMPFALVASLSDDRVTGFELQTDEAARPSVTEDRVVSVFKAVPEMAVVGGGPVAEAVAEIAALVGWKVQVLTDAASAAGVIAVLSRADKVVVAAHDLELAGAALLAAIESDAGYIGSVGSRRMQENRADWLAYRGVTDLSRVHGPAGLDIGAETPGEIAVSVLAEAISVNAGTGRIETR
jgi:xanthine dehydrogenase accessory factor